MNQASLIRERKLAVPRCRWLVAKCGHVAEKELFGTVLIRNAVKYLHGRAPRSLRHRIQRLVVIGNDLVGDSGKRLIQRHQTVNGHWSVHPFRTYAGERTYHSPSLLILFLNSTDRESPMPGNSEIA